jgi:hypothetical protein
LTAKIDSPIKRARLAAAFSLERLKQQVADSSSQQFPGDHPGPQRWLNLVSGLLDTASLYLADLGVAMARPLMTMGQAQLW